MGYDQREREKQSLKNDYLQLKGFFWCSTVTLSDVDESFMYREGSGWEREKFS